MIEIMGNAFGATGFAQHIRQLLVGLKRINATGVKFSNRSITQGSLDSANPEAIDAIKHYQSVQGDPKLYVLITQPPLIPNIYKNQILYFPWETCSLPRLFSHPTIRSKVKEAHQADWSLACEQAYGVIGTSKFCEDVYRSSSPNANILGFVYPPVDQKTYSENGDKLPDEYFIEPDGTSHVKAFKLLIVGKYEPRKNLAETLIAASLALAGTDSIIMLKTSYSGDKAKDLESIKSVILNRITNSHDFAGMNLPKIFIITDNFTDETMAKLHRTADLTVLMSHGEGFGYPVAQSLMCGVDAVATNATALPELLDNDKDRLISCYRAPIHYGGYVFFHASMDWYYPMIDDAITKILSAFIDSKTTIRKRRTAELCRRAKELFTPEASAKKFMEIINKCQK